ncbi:hypothetical protein [Hymenobacter cheonanensis]|uniref:hypothetical protein n=1 Tax=Hymenobacter sp. CA2-7 TaxID=3063993 RepID=UPI00271310A1|nr:hypothetical protein [Hymenobacter sp. CA2-7]MDO7885344.1 hypothetical protein [Hymenobacter sp. CA2-7]
MLLSYDHEPLLVDLPDLVIGGTLVKRRARRRLLTLPDDTTHPCVLEVEVIPYQPLADGSYGPELSGGVFRRYTPPALLASPLRLVESETGRILASRYLADGSLMPDAEWSAAVAELAADEAVQALPQNLWFCRMMRQQPVVVDEFIKQYIQLAGLTGDLN